MNFLLSMLAATLLVVAAPALAQAHLVNTGLGPFYDGAMHLFLSPGDVLGLLAVILLAGLHGTRASRQAVIALSLAWVAAGLAGLSLPSGLDLSWLSVLFLVALGALVALNPPLPPGAVALTAAACGALHGLSNGSALASVGAGPLSLAGIGATVLVTALLCSAWIVTLQAFWVRIVLRVAGSWIAATGMLMLGWLVKSSG